VLGAQKKGGKKRHAKMAKDFMLLGLVALAGVCLAAGNDPCGGQAVYQLSDGTMPAVAVVSHQFYGYRAWLSSGDGFDLNNNVGGQVMYNNISYAGDSSDVFQYADSQHNTRNCEPGHRISKRRRLQSLHRIV
jgi:hypothetical protein